MDVLVSGSERPPRQVPRWLPLAAVVAVVVAAGGWVLAQREAERRAADLSGVQVDVRVLDSRREMGGGLFGTLAVLVRDPQGGPLRVGDVHVDVPGLAHAPDRSLPRTGGALEVQVRFVVPECPRLELPGQVVVRAARGDRPLQPVSRRVTQGGAPDGSPLLVACGRLPQPGLGAPE